MVELCAPDKEYKDGSCYSLDELVKMVNSYNKRFTNNQIPMIYNKKYLVKELNSKLKDVCNDQICWLEQDFVKNLNDDNINETFRPKGPSNSLKWLNTTNIDKVIKQYYKLYPEFIFYGAVPIDFDDLPFYGIKNIDFDKLQSEGKYKLGFVFNTDEHYKSGSHWIALFCNLKEGNIYFFDSNGIKPEYRIKKLVKRIYKYFKSKNNNNIQKRYNNIRHQFKNTECGVYSINFILRLLKGETFGHIIKNITYDDDMSKCRLKYFNQE